MALPNSKMLDIGLTLRQQTELSLNHMRFTRDFVMSEISSFKYSRVEVLNTRRYVKHEEQKRIVPSSSSKKQPERVCLRAIQVQTYRCRMRN